MSGAICRRSGCTGLFEDGYCTVCGLAELRSEAAASAKSPADAKVVFEQDSAVRSGWWKTAGEDPVAGRWATSARRSPNASVKRSVSGMVQVPQMSVVEPEAAVLREAQVPEGKRICAKCEGSLRREAGFCGRCGTRYSFLPTLRSGDVLAGQYEVRGPIAYGGLGWIYLAVDRLLSRYVVLKGLLNAQDASAAAAAVAERQFLAAVKHPNIVGIYNFVQRGTEGFIVMEYIGGKTLKQIRQERGPLPAPEAIAYMHRVLPAFAYLHRIGLVFCDFKPENVMLEGDTVKLIDLGGVRRIDDAAGEIYGTVGYSAPEAGAGPTPASDLFTVGRTLAVLLAEIGGFTREHRYTLPGPGEKPLFASEESLYRFLLKATAQRPEDRFADADEMGEQLLGVLREVVARETGVPQAGAGHEFGADPLAVEPGDVMAPVIPDPRFLPVPVAQAQDPGLQAVAAGLLLADTGRRIAALRQAVKEVPLSREAPLRLAGALTEAGQFEEAETVLRALTKSDPWDWRALWYLGRWHLCRYQPDAACRLFDQVYADLPGELAPKLGLAFAAELGGDLPLADRMYALVATVDPSFVSAVFGLARCRHWRGDRGGAVTALRRIPPSSALHGRAQVEITRVLLRRGEGTPPIEDVLTAAAVAANLPLEELDRTALSRDIFEAALAGLHGGKTAKPEDAKVLGRALEEKSLRLGLEASLRVLARHAEGDERIALLDRANQVRPRTWF